jgi:hypothetical protein
MRVSSEFDESYWGSGRLIQNAIKKYGKENFKREVLHWCLTSDELIETEVRELKNRNVVESDEYYNLMDSRTPILSGKRMGSLAKLIQI